MNGAFDLTRCTAATVLAKSCLEVNSQYAFDFTDVLGWRFSMA